MRNIAIRSAAASCTDKLSLASALIIYFFISVSCQSYEGAKYFYSMIA